MITKPVSKIFNINGYGYASGGSKLSDLPIGNMVILDKTGAVVPITGTGAKTIDTLQGEFDIYYRDNSGDEGYVQKQPGSKHLAKSKIFNINYKPAEKGNNFAAIIKDYHYCCDGEYGFRFLVKNEELDKLFWPNGYYETYMVDNNECCNACNSTAEEDDNIIYLTLYKKIMEMAKSKDSVLKPSLIAVTAASGDNPESYTVAQVSSTDVDSEYEEYNDLKLSDFDGSTLALLIEVDESKAWPYAQYNFKYTHIRSTKFEVGLIANSKCGGNIITNETSAFTVGSENKGVFAIAQTSGYDVKQVEYQLMGYRENMSPYRLSDVTMTEFGYNYSVEKADEGKLYDILTVSYEQFSDAATVHMPYPMSIVFAFKNDNSGTPVAGGSTIAKNVATFFGCTPSTAATYKGENINLK